MDNKIKGILFYSKLSSDNNLFIKFLSTNDEIVTGIVFGGSSSKKKNIYQLGYFINFNLSKKKMGFPNNIKGEITAPYMSSILDDKFKIHSIMAIISILNLSIIEGQKIKGLYKITEEIINLILIEKNWIIAFFIYLFKLLKIIGYEIDYKSNYNKPYFDISSLKFENFQSNSTILFPHKLLKKEININYESSKLIFIIFEEIFQNNHLINMNLKLPIHFIKFKNLILNFLIKKNDKTYK